MSVPITYCRIVKAVDTEKGFRWLHAAMERNRKHGAFSQFPCECDPKCRELTKEELEDLNRRLSEPLPAEDDA